MNMIKQNDKYYAFKLYNKYFADSSPSQEKYYIKVVDYDGTVIDEVNNLPNGTEYILPNPPSHSGLTFTNWSSSETITNNRVTINKNNIMIGAIYSNTNIPTQSEFDIELTENTGLTINLNMNGTKDWGDGTSDTTKTHTYSNYGEYTIKCNGTTIDNGSTTKNLFGTISTTSFNYSAKRVRFSNSITAIPYRTFLSCVSLQSVALSNTITDIRYGSFVNCYSLESIVIPNNVTTIGSGVDGVFENTPLKSIIIPNSVTSIGEDAFMNCKYLKYVIIPNTVSIIKSNCFSNCNALEYISIPNTITAIESNAFNNCYSLNNINIPNTVTTIGNDAFSGCTSLESLVLPTSVTSLGNNFSNCNKLGKVSIPYSITTLNNYNGHYLDIIDPNTISLSNTITTISSNAFTDCNLYGLVNKIVFPSGLTNISASAFDSIRSVIEYNFRASLSIPTLANTNAFNNINKIAKIKVPWNLYQDWVIATNWATYANYIDGGTPATINFTGETTGDIYVNNNLLTSTSTTWVGLNMPYCYYDNSSNTFLYEIVTNISEGGTKSVNISTSSKSKITVSTGVSSLNAIFTIFDIACNASASGSDYYIYAVGSNYEISYFIDGGDNYMDYSGTLTTTGSAVTENVTLTPATSQAFTRPNLTANGTLGGESFAVAAEAYSTSSSYQAYRAVDSSTSTSYYWYSKSGGGDFTFYNPDAIKVTELTYKYTSTTYRASEITIQASNDGTNWYDIASTYSGSSTTYTSTLTNSKYYKYYKLHCTPSSTYIRLYDMLITAVQKVAA